MIRLLKNNQFATLLLVLVMLFGVGFLLFTVEAPYQAQTVLSPLSNKVQAGVLLFFGEDSKLPFLCALLLIVLQSVLFGLMAERHQLLYKNTWLPILFFGLFNMVFPVQLGLHPELLANTFLILAVMAMFQAQGKERALPALINAGILGGIAFLFSPGTFVFIPVFILGIMLFKPLSGLDIFQYLFGYALVLFACVTALYLMHRQDVVQAYLEMNYVMPGRGIIWREPYFLGFIVLLILIFVPTFYRLQRNFFRNTVRVRKLQQYLLVYLLFALLYSFIGIQSVQGAMSILALPLSVFITYYFLSDKRKWLRETVFLLFLFAIFSQHYQLF